MQDMTQLYGYASVFDRPDLAKDIVTRGAFTNSLKRRPAREVRILFNHDVARPIGRCMAIREDRYGLAIAISLAGNVPDADATARLVEHHAIDGLSIGFRPLRFSYTSKKNGTRYRLLTEIDLWEVSIVTFPLHPEARLRSVSRPSQPSSAGKIAIHQSRKPI